MEFTNSTLAGLMATPPDELEIAAERANLFVTMLRHQGRQEEVEAELATTTARHIEPAGGHQTLD